QQPPEEDVEEEDPRWELIRQLVEYKKFKEAAESLESHALEQEKIFYRQGGQQRLKPKAQSGLGKVEVLDLVRAFQQILQAAQERHGFREIYEDKFTVSEKIEYVLDLLSREKQVKFSSLFHQTSTRGEIVVTFLAVLELIRLKQLQFEQSNVFGEIEIIQAKPIVEDIEIKGAFEDE
ncbi:MAG: segregation/condensation protein A, partial [Verrucomicrobiota bacterium]